MNCQNVIGSGCFKIIKKGSNVKDAMALRDKAIKSAFSKMKEELDMHLDSINGNTQEINANFEHIASVEQKIDKLSERFDEMQMVIASLAGSSAKTYDKSLFENTKLSVREQEVFLVLYTEKEEISYHEAARRIGLTPDLVEKYVKILIAKGVPINIMYKGMTAFITLEDNFRDLQTKENVLHINEDVSSIIS